MRIDLQGLRRKDIRCGNIAAILKLDDNLNREYKIFEAAPQVGDHHGVWALQFANSVFCNHGTAG